MCVCVCVCVKNYCSVLVTRMHLRSESGGTLKQLDLLGPPGTEHSFEIECVEVISFNND